MAYIIIIIIIEVVNKTNYWGMFYKKMLYLKMSCLI